MANKKLTDLPELTTPADNDFLYIVDVSDTTESAQGTSKKIRKNNITADVDLQKVLDVNGEAFFNNLEGSQYVAFFKGEEGASKKSVISSGSDAGSSEIYIIDTDITLRNFNQITQENTSVGGSEGQFSIFQTGNSGAASTSVAFTPPLVDTSLNFPAKTIAGTYTLATTDEVVDLTTSQDIAGDKVFLNTPLFNSSIIRVMNSDGNGDGQIENNLDRYLFKNRFGYLQFLIQDSGFVTYKSPTIAGTFSNVNLTASRTFTLPDVTGTIPIVSQTITNGVTNKSPSEDAVFDATFDAVKTIITDTPTSTNTLSVSEVLMHTYAIAGGKLPSSCMPNLKVRISKSGTAGTVTIKVRVNTVNDFATAANIGLFTTVTSSKAAVFVRNFTLQGGRLTTYNASNSLVSDEAVSGVDAEVITYDPSITQYWFFSLQNSSALDTTRIHSIKLVN